MVIFGGRVFTSGIAYDELRPDVPICMRVLEHATSLTRKLGSVSLTWIEMINSQPTDPGRESLIQPKFIPPVHRDEVSEPLVSKLYDGDMSDRDKAFNRDPGNSNREQPRRRCDSYTDCQIFLRRRERLSSGRSPDPNSPWLP